MEGFRGDLEAGLQGIFGLDFMLVNYGDITKAGGRTDTRIEPCPQFPVGPPIVK